MAEAPHRSPADSGVHPLLAALRAVHTELDAVSERDVAGRPAGWMSAEGMSPDQLREAVRLGAELEGRLAGLRLHTVAAADAAQAYEECADSDTGAWAAKAAINRARSWGGVWLAGLLDRKYAHVRAGLASGRIGEEHAEIIVRAAEKVPAAVGAAVSPGGLAECERVLVERAEHLNPRRLRRVARRMLEPLGRRLADAHESALLTEEEQHAEWLAVLALDDNGDGTWSGRFTVPDQHGHTNFDETFGSHATAVAVEVDAATGLVRVLEAVMVVDSGVVINPTIVEGQHQGGFVQGVGNVLHEAVVYSEHGQPLCSTLVDYTIPGAHESVALRVVQRETPSEVLGGFRGAGEAAITAAPAVLVAAVEDALSPFGVRLSSTRLHADSVWRAIAEADRHREPVHA